MHIYIFIYIYINVCVCVCVYKIFISVASVFQTQDFLDPGPIAVTSQTDGSKM